LSDLYHRSLHDALPIWMIGTLVLAGIVLMLVCVFIILRLNRLLTVLSLRKTQKDRDLLKEEILNLEGEDVAELLQKRREALEFRDRKSTRLNSSHVKIS